VGAHSTLRKDRHHPEEVLVHRASSPRTGLPLATQEHGGTIEVDSKIGEFTEFVIRLPRSFQSAITGVAA
jgi:nitrogen-specific signal transduction histidine kinase